MTAGPNKNAKGKEEGGAKENKNEITSSQVKGDDDEPTATRLKTKKKSKKEKRKETSRLGWCVCVYEKKKIFD